MQEFETTVIEMAEKYEEDKAKMEKEKTEVTFVFFYFIYYVERKLYQCTPATRFGHLNSAFSRLFDLKSEKQLSRIVIKSSCRSQHTAYIPYKHKLTVEAQSSLARCKS